MSGGKYVCKLRDNVDDAKLQMLLPGGLVDRGLRGLYSECLLMKGCRDVDALVLFIWAFDPGSERVAVITKEWSSFRSRTS